jgi:sugar fermentation stimulation protein A
MRFPTPLVPARLIRRYKRFFADMELQDGREVTAHCPNTGPMTGLVDPGQRCWIEPNDDPKKKLRFGWRMVEHEDGNFTGVDTSVPNRMLKAALMDHRVPELADWPEVRPEVKYGQNSRIDFLLSGGGLPDAYVEVKSVTLLREAGLGEFPDTVTTRGAKHLDELARVAAEGHRAVIFYLVQRTDCDRVAVAGDLDPGYGAAFERARAAGVEVLCYDCGLSPEGVELGRALPFVG